MDIYYAIKQNMTQTWDKNGKRLPVTVVKAEPMVVTQVKTLEKDGYNAIQVGIGKKKSKHVSTPLKGHLKSFSDSYPRYLAEIRTTDAPKANVGDILNVSDILNVGDVVNVAGITKGRGFSGVMKRWGFHGGPKTHGQSDRSRAPGSIGQGTDPGRVHKGKKMAGRYGNQTMTIRNLTVINIDDQQNVWLSGPIPGIKGDVVTLSKKRNTSFPGLFYETAVPVDVEVKAEEVETDPIVEAAPVKEESETKE